MYSNYYLFYAYVQKGDLYFLHCAKSDTPGKALTLVHHNRESTFLASNEIGTVALAYKTIDDNGLKRLIETHGTKQETSLQNYINKTAVQ